MPNIKCRITLNTDEKEFVFSGLDSKEMILKFSSDIDFTPIVDKLTEAIDTNTNIIIEDKTPKDKDETAGLVYALIEEIFTNYTNIINEASTDTEDNE